jgi:hypothetical protein
MRGQVRNLEFVSVTTFEDLDAVRAFAGPEYEREPAAVMGGGRGRPWRRGRT